MLDGYDDELPVATGIIFVKCSASSEQKKNKSTEKDTSQDEKYSKTNKNNKQLVPKKIGYIKLRKVSKEGSEKKNYNTRREKA